MRHTILLQATTPIAHGDTVTGIDNQTNTRIFMRQGMIVDGKPARVPAISENALRAVLFRNGKRPARRAVPQSIARRPAG